MPRTFPQSKEFLVRKLLTAKANVDEARAEASRADVLVTEAVIALRDAGVTLVEIGELLGVTHPAIVGRIKKYEDERS